MYIINVYKQNTNKEEGSLKCKLSIESVQSRDNNILAHFLLSQPSEITHSLFPASILVLWYSHTHTQTHRQTHTLISN